MIDFNNPFRPDIEKIIFPNEDAVNAMFNNMDVVLTSITESNLPDELLEINKSYLQQCLSYEAISNDDRDLSAYLTVV